MYAAIDDAPHALACAIVNTDVSSADNAGMTL
jgi:hypothetical protein